MARSSSVASRAKKLLLLALKAFSCLAASSLVAYAAQTYAPPATAAANKVGRRNDGLRVECIGGIWYALMPAKVSPTSAGSGLIEEVEEEEEVGTADLRGET